MVLKHSGKCIFSCNSKTCVNDSTETFREVICPYHLSSVFGLKVQIQPMDKESVEYYIGPFLIIDNSFSFEPNTVVFPERNFIDQHLSLTDTTQDYFNYKMNPRMATYLQNLLALEKHTPVEARYQMEVIRNLFFPKRDSDDVQAPKTEERKQYITLMKNSEESNKNLLREIQTRFKELNAIIDTEDYNKLFQKIKVFCTSSDKIIEIKNFTNFMKFMIFNCLTDEHQLPNVPNTGVGITCYANLVYKKGIGLITVHELIHPMPLVISGETVGTNNFYQLKIRAINKRTVQDNRSIHKSNLADNLRPSNILNLPTEYCWRK